MIVCISEFNMFVFQEGDMVSIGEQACEFFDQFRNLYFKMKDDGVI